MTGKFPFSFWCCYCNSGHVKGTANHTGHMCYCFIVYCVTKSLSWSLNIVHIVEKAQHHASWVRLLIMITALFLMDPLGPTILSIKNKAKFEPNGKFICYAFSSYKYIVDIKSVHTSCKIAGFFLKQVKIRQG